MRQARLFALLGASLVLTACAAAPAPRAAAPVNFSDSNNADYDAVKVAAVTQWAHDKGASVIWLHYPIKKATRDGS